MRTEWGLEDFLKIIQEKNEKGRILFQLQGGKAQAWETSTVSLNQQFTGWMTADVAVRRESAGIYE